MYWELLTIAPTVTLMFLLQNSTDLMKFNLGCLMPTMAQHPSSKYENRYEMDFKTVYAINNKKSGCIKFNQQQSVFSTLSIYSKRWIQPLSNWGRLKKHYRSSIFNLE